MNYNYDAIVIGAGSGGLTSAIGLNNVGKKVLLVEKSHMGGDCTNYGCIPSKTLIHHAHIYSCAKERAGETTELKKYRNSILGKVRAQVLEIRNEESPEALEKHYSNLKILKGEARLLDKHTVEVDGKHFAAKNIIIATGSKPAILDIPGLEKEHILTNKNLFELKEIPEKLLIIGAGAISCEMAEAFALLDSKVTMVVRKNRLLKTSEPEISEAVADRFKGLGIKIYFQSNVVGISSEKAMIECNEDKTCVYEETFDYILMGTGRVPAQSSLGLKEVDINHDEHGIKVDAHYRTNKKNVFAVGDIATEQKFTHVADDQGRHVVKKILFPLAGASNKKPIPSVIFLQNEVAQVGTCYSEAEKQFHPREIIKITLPFERTDRAKTDKLEDGLAVVTVKRLTGRILGAQIYARNAGELINVFTNAIQHRISLWKLGKTIYPYPTLARFFKKIGDLYLSSTFRDLKKDIIHLVKKHLPKVVALIFWLTILYLFSEYKERNDLTSLDIAQNLYNYITGSTYGPLVYILVYAFRPLILFPATLLTLLSGALFGFWIGTIYTIIGENLSANFAYLLGRLLGKDIIPQNQLGLLSRWKSKLVDNGFTSVMIMRFIYLPFDMVNYGCGIFGVKWREYALATFIGILPGLMTFVSFGASIDNIAAFDASQVSIDPMQLAISFTLFASSIIFARYIKKRKHIKSD